MTNNPTIDGVIISYELGERIYAWLDRLNSKSGDVNEADELRTLLNAPVVEPTNDLREHCKQCAEVVKTWPEWKQNCLGGAPVVERQPVTWIDSLCLERMSRQPTRNFVVTGEKRLGYDVPLYIAPPEVAALQSTIAQLEDKLNKAIDLDFQRRETIARLDGRIAELESGRGEPFGWVDEPYAGWIKDRSSKWATIWNTDGSNNPSRRGQSIALYTAPPAPAAVVLPDDWQDRLFAEMERRFELPRSDDDRMVNDDTQIGVEFARDWIECCLDATAALNKPTNQQDETN